MNWGKLAFWFGLVGLVIAYAGINFGLDTSALSSDVWAYQFLELQEHFHYWQDIPPSYNQSELYLAFPLFYLLNPGLEGGLAGYHVLALLVIVVTYLVSGWVTYKIFKNWWLAVLGGILPLIPRFIFPTRIGLLDLGSLRGNVLASPFYFLLSYYWLTSGLASSRKNVLLAVAAGLLVYVYPPAGIITVGSYVVAALLVHRTKYLRQTALFVVMYLAVTSPFWLNHFTSQNTGMLDDLGGLSSEQLNQQSEIIQYKFRGSGFLRTVDLAELKRSLWDESLLALIFVFSLVLVRRKREILSPAERQVSTFNVWFIVLTIVFIGAVEIANAVAMRAGHPPVFVDHLRPMRAVGFALIMQFILTLHLLYRAWGWRVIPTLLALVLILTPIRFFAPVIRPVVRVVVPESIRWRYNLAPRVRVEKQLSFSNLKEAALWARKNLPPDRTKFFVFNDAQRELQFKLLSRQDTNLISKEGSLWVTSGFANSRRWYEEQVAYKEKVEQATDFRGIVAFARELKSTHLLLPRGRWSELYEESGRPLKVVFANSDYQLLELN